jgi:hypothetical protein
MYLLLTYNNEHEYIPRTIEGHALQCRYRLTYGRKSNVAYYVGNNRQIHWYDGRAALASSRIYRQSYSSSGGYGRRERY